ncbi:MAG: hypothetical protein JWQ88_3205 [Rhodoferax sp.]|nr:hypothetical protein [Rhodoferax sp.]
MKLVLVRHGRPDEDDPGRPHDPPLRADGHLQAQAVAALLAREGVTHVVASPQLRARQTAEPLARRLGLSVRTIDGWAEADRAAPRYRSTETLRAAGTQEWARFLADPVRYVGGDPDTFHRDVLAALQETIALGPEARVAVFTHGLAINVVLSHALRLDGIVHFGPGYGSLTRLRVRADGGIGVSSINESGHHALASLGSLTS